MIYQGQLGQYLPQQQGGQFAPQQQNGHYPPQQPQNSQQYSQPLVKQASPSDIAGYKKVLQAAILEKQIQNMIPLDDPILDKYASLAGAKVEQLCSQWRVPLEVGRDVAKLAIFDIVLFVGKLLSQSFFKLLRMLDNSGSMQFDEAGSRIDDLKLILSRAVHAAMLFDEDGISVRFMHKAYKDFDNVKSEQELNDIMSHVEFKFNTPLGGQLRAQVLEPLVLEPARRGQLRKPVMVIVVTDGEPLGEPRSCVHDAILYASRELSRMPKYGKGALSLQFAQVGKDETARDFLSELDTDPQIGSLVDCTSCKLLIPDSLPP